MLNSHMKPVGKGLGAEVDVKGLGGGDQGPMRRLQGREESKSNILMHSCLCFSGLSFT